jgi:urate oxidase
MDEGLEKNALATRLVEIREITMAEYSVGFNTHGKGRVRVVKVTRNKSTGVHDVVQYSVQLLLEGDGMDEVFVDGNNRQCVATDTCKNTVYYVANQYDFKSVEEYGVLLAKHFLDEYPAIVNKITVKIVKDRWERLENPDSKGKMGPHKHAFKRIGPNRPYTHVTAEKRPTKAMNLSIQSGFRDLEIMKTTQSGFTNFHRGRLTTLPDSDDRLLATSMTAEWNYVPMTNLYEASIARILKTDFNKISEDMEFALVNGFAGPSDTGVFSNSMQQTLFDMGKAALAMDKTNVLDMITLEMPNIHNIAFPLGRFGQSDSDHSGSPTIFFPIDEPHGMIKAEVKKGPKAPMRSKL